MSHRIPPKEDRRVLGIGLVLLGFVSLTIVDSCVKWLTLHGGLPTLQVVFIRYAAQVALVLALFLPAQGTALVETRRLPLEILRAVALLGSTVLNFFAILFLPLTITAAISFTSPLILVALSVPLLGEIVGWRRWLAIALGFVGILIVVRPSSGTFSPAVLLCLLAAICNAFYMLLTRKLAGVDSTATQQFYVGVVSTLAVFPFALDNWVWPTDNITWMVFGLIGVIGFVGHQFIIVAHRFAPASVLAPFTYVQIISMTASSWLIFNQPPEIWLYIGAPLVIASGLYIWFRERQLGKLAVAEERT